MVPSIDRAGSFLDPAFFLCAFQNSVKPCPLMKKADLNFSYPDELIATHPVHPPRVLWVENGNPVEVSFEELLTKPKSGDLLVINETKVLKRRIFAQDLEILFIKQLASQQWQVLFPSRKTKVGESVVLPEGVLMTLIERGRPQLVSVSSELTDEYFQRWGELPLPPYIQAARQARHQTQDDMDWYQTHWAKEPGSLAAPTASLHFREADLQKLRDRGVQIETLVLHVGLGTFLPVTSENLEDHKMHEEEVFVSRKTWDRVQTANKNGQKVWALGTTVARSLESVSQGILSETHDGYRGKTALFLRPGSRDFAVVDVLMTNFHQPESTLLALVAAFTNLALVLRAYQFAIQKKFRLFSYGDLSVWIK